MPNERPAAGRFPHLRLVHRNTAPAKFPPGGKTDARVKANKADRVGHSRRLKASLEKLIEQFQRRSADRASAGLSAIESGIPFVIEVPKGFDLDKLVLRFKVEIVAERSSRG